MHFPPSFIMDSIFNLPISLRLKEHVVLQKLQSDELWHKIITKKLPADTAPVIVKINSSSFIGYR